MPLHPLLEQLLMPQKPAVIFAFKGVLSMALALFVAMYLQMDRPYWAVVSAVFLQVRPQSGRVIEKAICQMSGSVVGGAVGILVLAFLMPYPSLALLCLTLWIGLNSAASSTVHNTNFIYAFAMAGMTAGLIVVLVMVHPATADSEAVFAIAQARIGELVIGALCAMLVSRLILPVKVKHELQVNARTVINQTLDYFSVQLDPNSTHEQRHEHADSILETLVLLSDDSTSVRYEGPEGPGRGRAATLICNRTLSLLAVIQILGRFQRYHAELVSPVFRQLLETMRSYFRQIAQANSYEESYRLTQVLRRNLLDYRAGFDGESAIIVRLTQTALQLVADLALVLKAYHGLENPDRTLLNATRLRTHPDPITGAITGFRTALIFLIGAVIWVATASQAATMVMVMPVVFSIMFARFPPVVSRAIFKRLLVGVVIAVPVALFFGLGMLARSTGDFELLLLVLAGPYFAGLLCIANQRTLPYGLGFCVHFTLIVQPGNNMAFSADTAVSTALGLLIGVSVLYWVFKLVTPPDNQNMKHRLLRVTARDLRTIDQHANPEHWFNARMGDRLLKLVTAEQGMGSQDRYMTDLGITGLNLGHVSIRLRRLIGDHRTPEVETALGLWQQALADAYVLCARGRSDGSFREASATLLDAIITAGMPPQQTDIAEGMFERLALTFERIASSAASANGDRAEADKAASTVG